MGYRRAAGRAVHTRHLASDRISVLRPARLRVVASRGGRHDRLADECDERRRDGRRLSCGLPSRTRVRREPLRRALRDARFRLYAERLGARVACGGAGRRRRVRGVRHRGVSAMDARRERGLVRGGIRALRPRHGGASQRALDSSRAPPRGDRRAPSPLAALGRAIRRADRRRACALSLPSAAFVRT